MFLPGWGALGAISPQGSGRAEGPAGWGSQGFQPGSPGAVPQDLLEGRQQSLREHCTFNHDLLKLRQWISVMTQKLEAYRGDTGPWDVQSREAEVEVR